MITRNQVGHNTRRLERRSRPAPEVFAISLVSRFGVRSREDRYYGHITYDVETSAWRTRVRNASSSNGFMRKATAPPPSAVARIPGTSWPVTTITFVFGETRCNRDCTSRPLVFGIQTSSTARGTGWLLA